MTYDTYSFRYADVILNQEEFSVDYHNVLDIIDTISEQDIIDRHDSLGVPNPLSKPKSISVAINQLLKERFVENDWKIESPIFQDREYADNRWRLDFARGTISIEVAFNHSGSIAWNLIKPALASELNHVRKAIQTKVGIIITATNAMRVAGGFDGAIGTFETFQTFLKPFNGILSVPLLIIGLLPPQTFRIEHVKPEPRKTIGQVIRIDG
jgi:hypothetical protein